MKTEPQIHTMIRRTEAMRDKCIEERFWINAEILDTKVNTYKEVLQDWEGKWKKKPKFILTWKN